MRIEVKSVIVENKGKYKAATVEYTDVQKNEPGKKMLVSFGNFSDTFLVMAQAKQGETYDVELKKGDKFWDWASATKVETLLGNPVKAATPSPKSTYETPEERAAKQVYIVRQSSLERAIQLFELQGNKKVSENDVTKLAQFFTDFVMGKESNPMLDIINIDNDVPV